MAENAHKYMYSDVIANKSDTDLAESAKQNTVIQELHSKKNISYDDYIQIKEHSNKELILKSYADEEMRKIFETIHNKSRSVMEILNECSVPQTSAYRKITLLIQKGLLIPDGFVIKHGRKIIKYTPLFKDVKIGIFDNRVAVEVKLAAKNK